MQNKEKQMAHNRLNGLTQTAVEWLFDQLGNELELYNTQWLKIEKIVEEAKEMEKQQIIDAITIGFDEGRLYMHNGTTKFETGIEYYNETFKNK